MSWLKKTSNKEFAICAAIANLYFLSTWRTFLVPARQYHLALPAGPLDFAVLGVNIVLLALLIYAFLTLVRHKLGEFAANGVRTAYLVSLFMVVVTSYRPDIADAIFGVSQPFRIRLTFTVMLSGLIPLVFRNRPTAVVRGFSLAGLVILPCLALTTLKAAESILVRHVQSGSAVDPRATNNPNAGRTALIIFDMLDYEVLFKEKTVPTPEFNRLRNDSFFATKAMSSSEWTLTAIPTLTTGKIVTAARPVSNDDLMLSFQDSSEEQSWKLNPNIFSDARTEGIATGLVGWYHPYCRIFGSSLNYCEWVPHMERFNDRSSSVPGIERAIAEATAMDLLSPHPPRFVQKTLAIDTVMRQKYISSYQKLLNATKHALTDPSLGFVVVHMAVPHTPSIYDRKTGQFTTKDGDYLDNVALADRTVGEIRRAMEQAGEWDNTNIVVTADHGYRDTVQPAWSATQTPYHVPFFVKMAGNSPHLEDDQPLMTARVHDLLLALLEKRVVTAEQVRDLIHTHPTNSYISQAGN